MDKKTTILAVAGTILLASAILGSIAGYSYFQECLWDNEYIKVIRELPESEQMKRYEHLLETAKEDKKPHIRYSLSSQYMGVREFQKAKAHLIKAEEEYRKIGDVGGQVKVLYSLGAVSLATDKPDDAEKYMSQALNLLGDKEQIECNSMPLFGLRMWGSPSTSKIYIMSSIARIKARTGHPAEAEALYKQALLSKNALERMQAYTDYADFLTNQKRPEEAAALLKTAEESLATQKHSIGEYDNSALALSSLASHYEFAGEFSQALRLYKQCAERAERENGANSDERIEKLVHVAHCYEKMGQEKEEKKALEEAYKLAKEPGNQAKGEPRLQHWCIIHAAGPLADFHVRKKNYAKAESLYRESIDLLAAHEKDVVVSLRGFDWTKGDLAACLAAEGKTEEAESLYRDAAKALESDTRPGPITRYKVLNGYSTFLHSLGKEKESNEFARKAQAYKI